MNEQVEAIRLDEADNVVTVIQAAAAGACVRWGEGADEAVTAREAIPRFHKIAIADLAAGEEIRKYGSRIGLASAAIPKGGYVHIHNCVGTAVEELIS